MTWMWIWRVIANHVKRVFGIGRRVQPLMMSEVRASPPEPEMAELTRQATSDLVHETMKAERKSWEVRQELANSVLNILVKGRK